MKYLFLLLVAQIAVAQTCPDMPSTGGGVLKTWSYTDRSIRGNIEYKMELTVPDLSKVKCTIELGSYRVVSFDFGETPAVLTIREGNSVAQKLHFQRGTGESKGYDEGKKARPSIASLNLVTEDQPFSDDEKITLDHSRIFYHDRYAKTVTGSFKLPVDILMTEVEVPELFGIKAGDKLKPTYSYRGNGNTEIEVVRTTTRGAYVLTNKGEEFMAKSSFDNPTADRPGDWSKQTNCGTGKLASVCAGQKMEAYYDGKWRLGLVTAVTGEKIVFVRFDQLKGTPTAPILERERR